MIRRGKQLPGRFLSPFFAAGVVFFAFFLAGDGTYLFEQGLGFLRTLAGAKDITALRSRVVLDADTDAFFERLDDIRRYAVEELGLSQNDSFSRYVYTDRDYLVDVVSAVRADSFERKTWRYPVVGSVFYRGFYDAAAARREAARLEKAGFDVLVRPVRAFSSLGIFADPAYSFMAGYREYDLANLLIHEQMHATIWVPGDNRFNEEIATFVGDVGAQLYIRDKYGEDSPEYQEIAPSRRDRETFRAVIRGIHADLQAAYSSLHSRDGRLVAKERIFREAQKRFAEEYDARFLTDRYRGFAVAALNNAYIDSYMSYMGDLGLYHRLLDHSDGDPAAVIRLMGVAARNDSDPRAYLESRLHVE